MTDVMVLMGSKADLPIVETCTRILDELGIPHEVHVASAHRTPAYVEDLVEGRDVKVFVTVAAGSTTLPGLVAATTARPVIGVPVGGTVPYDSLLSMVQSPPGVPIATVGVDRGDNAAYLAAQMLGIADAAVAARVAAQRERAADEVLQDDRDVQTVVDAA